VDQETPDRSRPWLAVGAEIAELLPRIDADEFDALRREFDDPKRRWFFSGQGRSGLSAKMAAMRVMHMGRECHVLGEVTCPSVRSGDGIVFVSGSGETPTTVAFARIARAEGARIIALTSHPDSTLAQIADVVLDIPVTSSDQLAGNLFETTALIVLDSIVNDFGAVEHANPNATLHYWHTNMQ
jgi:6-phospho-3-hexuloisomerase